MTDTSALLPCPFCGERAETDFIPEHHSYQIECSDSMGCTARVTRDSEEAAIEAWNRRAPAPAPTDAAPDGPVARIEGIDEYGPRLEWTQHWVDVGVGAKLYTASQVQAMLAAVPRNATLYDPDDVAFPARHSADGTDALPPELASTAAAKKGGQHGAE